MVKLERLERATAALLSGMALYTLSLTVFHIIRAADEISSIGHIFGSVSAGLILCLGAVNIMIADFHLLHIADYEKSDPWLRTAVKFLCSMLILTLMVGLHIGAVAALNELMGVAH